MKEQKNVPKLRFPEFTGEWEQRKLGKLLRTLPYKPYLKAPEKDGRYEIIQQGNDPIIGFANGTPCEDYRRAVIFGDHTLSLYKPQKPFFVATDGVRILQGVNDMDGNYLLHLLEKNKPQSEGYKRYYSILADKEVFFSANHNEQIQIGLYFKRLDTLISLQQRKLDQIKEYKKGMLQKMFPKDGESVPEVRFPGFTGEWEQKKLGELAEVKDSARIPNSEWTDSGVPYIRASDLTNDDTSGVLFISSERYDYYRSKTGAPAQGDVLFNGGGEIGKALLHSNNKPIYVQGGAVLYARTSVSESLDGQFLKTYFETPNAKSYIDIASAGGTMKHFTLKPSLEMPIQFPNIPEQLQLGSFFKSLDTLITLHQRKLDAMKEYKKGLLQQMFV